MTATEPPLWKTVLDLVVKAAEEDPRFTAVQPEELAGLCIEISVLSPMVRVKNPEEIVPGRDGVFLRQGRRQGLFLPQVAAEHGWTREQLLGVLCEEKAGLPANAWRDPRTEISRFTAEVFEENRGKRVLVAEDDEGVSELLRHSLEREGYTVELALTGEIALEKLKEGAVDLVTLDLALPRISGYEVLEELKKVDRLRTIPVIVITSRVLDDPHRLLLESTPQVKAFLTKPVELKGFLKAVRRLVEP